MSWNDSGSLRVDSGGGGKLEGDHENVAVSGKIWHVGRNHLGLRGT